MTITKAQGLNDYSVRVRAPAYDYDYKINIDKQDFYLGKDWKFNQILNNTLKVLTHEKNHHSRTEFSQVKMRRGWFRNYLELYNNESGSEIISPKPTLGYSGISCLRSNPNSNLFFSRFARLLEILEKAKNK